MPSQIHDLQIFSSILGSLKCATFEVHAVCFQETWVENVNFCVNVQRLHCSVVPFFVLSFLGLEILVRLPL